MDQPLDPIEQAFVRAIVAGSADEGAPEVFADWLEERQRIDDAARVRSGGALEFALDALLAGGAAYDLLSPLLIDGMIADDGPFERARAEAILGAVERSGATDPRWRSACDAARRSQRFCARPAYEALDRFVSEALAMSRALPVTRGMPWCGCEQDAEAHVRVYGIVYDELLEPRAFYVTFDRAAGAQGWHWEIGLDAVDADGESEIFVVHPCLGQPVSALVWRHRIRSQTPIAEPTRPGDASRETWDRVFALVVSEGDALALCRLQESGDDLHANGYSLDMLSINTLGNGMMSGRGIADLVARLLNERDGGGRTYMDYYSPVRSTDATDEEVSAFRGRCAQRGVRIDTAG